MGPLLKEVTVSLGKTARGHGNNREQYKKMNKGVLGLHTGTPELQGSRMLTVPLNSPSLRNRVKYLVGAGSDLSVGREAE